MRVRLVTMISLLSLLFCTTVYAQYQLENAFPNLTFNTPVEFVTAGDGSNRIFVVEQTGRIMVFENDPNVLNATTFLNLSAISEFDFEKGVLGLAFHPDYANNGLFYVNYSANANPDSTHISQFQVSAADSNIADPNSEVVLMRIYQPFSNHNGGKVAFGPDGYLYSGLGDGGAGGDPFGHSQNLNTLLGTMIRIDVDNQDPGLNYAIPPDNPFVGVAGALDEIYAYGLRNPWRFSFDMSGDGRLWLADVGQERYEEIDIIVSGGNYGWNKMEGFQCYPQPQNCDTVGLNAINPVHEYTHQVGASVTGGYVYRGSELPELDGNYIFGDYVAGQIWAFREGAAQQDTLLLQSGLFISSFGLDADNELYICSYTDGRIYRLTNPSAGGSAIICDVAVNPDFGDGNFVYTMTFENTSNDTQQVDIWGNMDTPQGSLELFSKTGRNFLPGAMATKNFQVNLPGNALDGDYEITINIGTYPNDVDESCMDIYTKIGSATLSYDTDATANSESVPEQTMLLQNYPNPFNPSTVIGYQLASAGTVTLKIYDISGREVRTLVSEHMNTGYYDSTWDGTNDAGKPVASGVYVYRLTHIPLNPPSNGDARGMSQTRKLMLVQ